MKKTVLLIALCALAVVFQSPAVWAGGETGMERTGASVSMLSAENIIDQSVTNMQGEELGSIQDLAIDTGSGKVAFAIVETEGKMVAVPLQAFSMPAEHAFLMLDMEKDKLASAPSIDAERLSESADRQWETEVFRFYGVEPYWQ